MRRYWFPKPYADTVARMRVLFGFLLVFTFGWFSDPSPRSLLIGLAIAFCGILLRAWAAGHLAKNQQLAQSGPYAYTRNPLYIGTLLTAAGLVTAGRSVLLAVIFAAIFLLVYLPAIELEEQHLRKLFPEFTAFFERVPMLLPRFSNPPGAARFSWALYLKNQEYQALLGFLLGAAFLAWKCFH